MPSPFQAGSARVDITPPLTIPYLGWRSDRHRFFEGVHDSLCASATVLSDGSSRLALVAADSIGFARNLLGDDRDFVAEVRQRIRRRCGIEPGHVMLCATHAHSTPETLGIRRLLDHPGAEAWLDDLVDRLADVVVAADGNRVPARLRTAAGRAEEIGRSRRVLGKDGRLYHWVDRPGDDEVEDAGTHDPEVSVLCLDTEAQAAETVWVHFATHPVTMQVQSWVSADFPGAAAARVRAAGNGRRQCLYLQGAAGDIEPARGETNDFADVSYYGAALATEVLRLIEVAGTGPSSAAAPRLGAAVGTVLLPSRPLPDAESLERERNDREAALGSARTAQEAEEAVAAQGAIDEKLERVRRGGHPRSAEVQVFRVGDTALVGLPGEPFCDLGLQMKQWPEAKRTLCLGYANDYLGYFAPPAAWQQGGYEVELGAWSIVGPDAPRLLAQTAHELVRELF